MRMIFTLFGGLATVVLAANPIAPADGAAMDLYSFRTTGEFVETCDVAEPPSDCMSAVAHVEEVVNSSDHPNETCDGGTDAMLKAGHAGADIEVWLLERVVRIVPWLKSHPEYSDKSYGDGIWTALKGVYCN